MTKALTAMLSGPESLQTLNTRLPVVISLLLIIACAYILSNITWSLFSTKATEEISQPGSNTVKPAQKNSSNLSFRQLTSAHLFGIAGVEKPVTSTAAPKTRLNLILKGVLADETGGSASAIIAQGKKGKEDIYSIDDKLSNGVTLKEIHPEHIMLERQGRMERLELVKDNEVGKITPGRSSLRSPTSGNTLQDIRQSIMKNPTSFSEYAMPVIVKENGKIVGYRLDPQKKGDQLRDLGLEPNDVITSLNGIKLNNAQSGISALRQLSSANEINIMVKRNGAEVPLNIQLQ